MESKTIVAIAWRAGAGRRHGPWWQGIWKPSVPDRKRRPFI